MWGRLLICGGLFTRLFTRPPCSLTITLHPPRRISESLSERRNKGAHAGISGVQCRRGNRSAFRQISNRIQHASLLPPESEAETGFPPEQALQRPLAQSVTAT